MGIWCKENGVDFDLAIEKGRGCRTQDTVAIVAPHLDAKKESMKIESYEEKLIETIEPIAGALDFLSKLLDEDWAIVTSSSLALATRKLKASRLPNPNTLVTADCVKMGKPDPEPYNKAIDDLGLTPKDCLVFEDADSGIISATEAGCKIVVIGGKTTVENPNIIARVQTYNQLKLSTNGTLSIETINT